MRAAECACPSVTPIFLDTRSAIRGADFRANFEKNNNIYINNGRHRAVRRIGEHTAAAGAGAAR